MLGLWDLHPSLEDVDESTTAAALIVAAAGHRFGLSLNALPPRAIRGAMDEVAAALAAGPGSDVHLFGRVVATLDEGAGSGLGDGSWLDAQGFEGTTSFLSATWAAMAVSSASGHCNPPKLKGSRRTSRRSASASSPVA